MQDPIKIAIKYQSKSLRDNPADIINDFRDAINVSDEACEKALNYCGHLIQPEVYNCMSEDALFALAKILENQGNSPEALQAAYKINCFLDNSPAQRKLDYRDG